LFYDVFIVASLMVAQGNVYFKITRNGRHYSSLKHQLYIGYIKLKIL